MRFLKDICRHFDKSHYLIHCLHCFGQIHTKHLKKHDKHIIITNKLSAHQQCSIRGVSKAQQQAQTATASKEHKEQHCDCQTLFIDLSMRNNYVSKASRKPVRSIYKN